MTADDNGAGPPRDDARDVFNDNWFSEDGTIEDVTDSTIGASPHLFEVEFFDSGFVGGDGGALDADVVFFNGVGGVNGDLIICLVAAGDAEVIVLDV
jgi:hypothetical protein